VDGAGGVGSERADLELVRVAVAPEGAFSVLLVDGVPAGPVCIERTYPVVESRPRGPQFVKIPAGRYRCVQTVFAKGGYPTFEVTGVTGHNRLLFHRGNAEGDSEGCILVGQRFGSLGASPAVLSSAIGFSEFMRLARGRPFFDLVVRGVS
jgi:hypothetical protein